MRCFATLLILASASCATLRDQPVRPRLPTPEEVASYIERSWETDGWNALFARFAGRPGIPATWLGVENVRCDYYYDNPDCTFDVIGRFATGEDARRNLSSSFEWRDGQLVGVIISVHTRPVR